MPNVIEIALRHGSSPVNLLHIFKTPFSRNTSEWLLLFSTIYNVHNLIGKLSFKGSLKLSCKAHIMQKLCKNKLMQKYKII